MNLRRFLDFFGGAPSNVDSTVTFRDDASQEELAVVYIQPIGHSSARSWEVSLRRPTKPPAPPRV